MKGKRFGLASGAVLNYCPICNGVTVARELFGSCIETDARAHEFDACVEIVKKIQPNNPFEPQTKFLKELVCKIEERMGLEKRSIAVYTAMGSSLGVLFGISAFVELNGSIVTLRATAKEHEDPIGFVDVIVDDGTDCPLEEAVENIAGYLQLRLKQKDQKRRRIRIKK